MRAVIVAAWFTAIVAVAPTKAWPCSVAVSHSVDILPDHGAHDVPLNAALMLTGDIERSRATLREVESGYEIPLRLEYDGDHYRVVRPTEPLAPNTRYVAEVYSGRELAGRSRFTTGDRVDLRPPGFTGLSGMTLSVARQTPDPGGCLDLSRMTLATLDYTPPRGAAYTVFELQYDRIPFSGDSVSSYDDLTNVLVGQEYCGRIVAYDLAGNAAGRDVERCAVAVDANAEPERTSRAPSSLGSCVVVKDKIPLKPAGTPSSLAILGWKLLDVLGVMGVLLIALGPRRRERARLSGRWR